MQFFEMQINKKNALIYNLFSICILNIDTLKKQRLSL